MRPLLEQTTQPTHVPPGAGGTVYLLGDTYTTLLSGAHTGGTFSLLEALVPARTGPPPHIHHAEDETFIAEIQIVAVDRDGLLADLVNAMTKLDMPLLGVNARVGKNGLATVSLRTQITGTQQLEQIIRHFQKLPEVMEVFRVGT